MDNLLDSVTRKGRKVKERLRGKKDKAGVNTAEEDVSSSSSLLHPLPHIAAGGHDGEGGGISTDTPQVHPRDISPQPVSVSIKGREDGREGRGVDAGEKEVSPGPSVEAVVGGRSGSTEIEPLSPSTPILPSGVSGGT